MFDLGISRDLVNEKGIGERRDWDLDGWKWKSRSFSLSLSHTPLEGTKWWRSDDQRDPLNL